MPIVDASARPRNHLLRSCCGESFSAFESRFTRVALTPGRTLYHGRMPIEMVHFIEDGLVVTTSANETDQGPVGAWIAGREGVVCGVPVALGVFTSPHKRVVISRGESLAIRRADFLDLLEEVPGLRAEVLAYVHRVLVETTQLCACNARHSVRQRLARVLLTAADRLGGEDLPMTHRLTAQMLGTRRASISDALGVFVGSGLVSLRRGAMTIVDRPALIAEACSCYGVIARLNDGREAAGAFAGVTEGAPA
ncbi:MAG TPA: Crp/Fnr family transcriptional regulator [Beijerinckiaceae bacterium]